MHVARWVEEVHADHASAHVLGEILDDGGDGQTAGVGGENRVGRRRFRDAGEQRLLDVEPLDDRLEHQIAAGDGCFEIVVEVARDHARGEGLVHERRRLGLEHLGDGSQRERVLCLGFRVGRRVRGHDVEQMSAHTRVGEVGRDLGTHGARPDHGRVELMGRSKQAHGRGPYPSAAVVASHVRGIGAPSIWPHLAADRWRHVRGAGGRTVSLDAAAITSYFGRACYRVNLQWWGRRCARATSSSSWV